MALPVYLTMPIKISEWKDMKNKKASRTALERIWFYD
jgi:hypothetical protein